MDVKNGGGDLEQTQGLSTGEGQVSNDLIPDPLARDEAAAGGKSAGCDEGGQVGRDPGSEEEVPAKQDKRRSYRPSLEVVKVAVQSFYEKGEFKQDLQVGGAYIACWENLARLAVFVYGSMRVGVRVWVGWRGVIFLL